MEEHNDSQSVKASVGKVDRFERTCLLLFLISCAIKILLFSSYHSTDFDVHRHWKAVTRHLPVQEWYFDDEHVATRHTLDYPPGFIWMEAFWAYSPLTSLLVLLNKNDDDDKEECLALLPDAADHSHQPVSSGCLVYMRLTVVLSDILLWIGAYAVSKTAWTSRTTRRSSTNKAFLFGPLALFVALVYHPALLWLDHVHFQYNGAMIGLWLFSLACLLRANQPSSNHKKEQLLLLGGAVCFATLLMMKHLYLTLAPWYGVYLFSRYCIVVKPARPKATNRRSGDTKHTVALFRFMLLATVTLITLMIPIVPFVWKYKFQNESHSIHSNRTLSDWFLQVLRRLFPFGRGLVHDYWAGNIWAFYAAAQKLCRRCLPAIKPLHTTLLLVLLQLPGLQQAYRAARLQCNDRLLTSLAYCGAVAFWVSFHVHEKAILNALVPLTIWAWSCSSDGMAHKEQVNDKRTSLQFNRKRQVAVFKVWWECTAWGTMGMVPLLYEPREMLLKGACLMTYLAASYCAGYYQEGGSIMAHTGATKSSTLSQWIEFAPFPYHCIALLLVWIQVDMIPVRFFGRWEFVPLAVTSLACGTGLSLSFLRLFYYVAWDS